jgi:hypothetical protein
MVFIFECDNKDEVENIIKKELLVKNILREKNIRGKIQKELFVTIDIHSIEKIKELFENTVNENKLQSIIDRDNKIKELEDKLNNNYEKELLIEKEKSIQLDIQYKMSENYKLEMQLKLAELNKTS